MEMMTEDVLVLLFFFLISAAHKMGTVHFLKYKMIELPETDFRAFMSYFRSVMKNIKTAFIPYVVCHVHRRIFDFLYD